MPILLGVQICTTSAKQSHAGTIMGKMENLLDQRRKFMITRRAFLTQWGKLRKALLLTSDYQNLIVRVRTRAKGMCEYCHKRSGVHVHHEVPVAFDVKLVFLDLNCKWTCIGCHEIEDRAAQMRARRNGRRRENRNYGRSSDLIERRIAHDELVAEHSNPERSTSARA